MKRKRWWTQPLEGDAQNIATYKLILDLHVENHGIRSSELLFHNHGSRLIT